MTPPAIARGTLAALLGLATVAVTPAAIASHADARQGLLYGRVTTVEGTVHEGRLRWGGDQEASWRDHFNGVKDGNPWAARVPPGRLTERVSIGFFGLDLGGWDREIDLGRPFLSRFGDIARIDATGREIRVTLKSGTSFDLDRLAADDLADGVRVWDSVRGIVDIGEWRIRSIEFLSGPESGAPAGIGGGASPSLLYGTVRTANATFTGFVGWDRDSGVGSDQLLGRTAEGSVALPFDEIRSIERRSEAGSLVTLVDGRQLALSGTRDAGQGNRGAYVDDPRYGRVLVSWNALRRLDFIPAPEPPTYDAFPPGRPLTGSVVTRNGRRLAGRLVYDLDESETTETLDAPSLGVDYHIPFGLVASIALPEADGPASATATVTLRSGERMSIDRTGDLARGNTGVLILFEDGRGPEYVPWGEVARLEFAAPPSL